MWHRELNKNEFIYAKRSYENGLEMMEMGYYREALYELKRARKILEKDAVSTRLLALVYYQMARSWLALDRKEKAVHEMENALFVLEQIRDTSSLSDEIVRTVEKIKTKVQSNKEENITKSDK